MWQLSGCHCTRWTLCCSMLSKAQRCSVMQAPQTADDSRHPLQESADDMTSLTLNSDEYPTGDVIWPSESMRAKTSHISPAAFPILSSCRV